MGHRFDIACHHLRDFLARNRSCSTGTTRRCRIARRFRAPRGRSLSGGTLARRAHARHAHAARAWRKASGLPTRPRQASTTSRSSAPGLPDSRPRSMARRKDCRRCWSSAKRPAGRPARRRASRTTWAFRRACPATTSRRARWRRRRRFGAELLVARCVDALERPATATAISGRARRRRARAMRARVILANGVTWRELDVPGAERARRPRHLLRRGAGPKRWRCQGQRVYLVGGGNSAGQAAMFFADTRAEVTLLVRGPSLADEHVALSHRAARHQGQHRGVHAAAASCR